MTPRPITRQPATVLIVKDGTAATRALELVLRDLGYHVLAETDARDALAVLDYYGAPIDLLVTNAVMPEMLGVELARRVQKRCPRANVLFFSAHPAEYLRRFGVSEADCVLFVEQPLRAAIVAEKVREALTSGNRREADAV
jgi:response regulator RpfG family c-di-GMP phosphodiesterase